MKFPNAKISNIKIREIYTYRNSQMPELQSIVHQREEEKDKTNRKLINHNS